MATTALALVGSAFAVVASAAPASAAGEGLVISEAYLNGGSSGATYVNKYVEIYNPTAAAIPLTGLSVQYRSGTGTGNAAGVAALSGTLTAGDYYVIQGGSNGANGIAVPNVDQVAAAINPGGASGTLALVDGTAAINPGSGATLNAAVRDLVGWGTSNTFETAVTVAASVTTSVSRNETNVDTNNNSADFAARATSPGTAYTPPPPPEEFTGTIAEIQGTDASVSPHLGDIATTKGVVTAVYPTGGFNGFFLQTEGTGGATDATPGAADGIFVFGTNAMAAAPVVGDYLQVVGDVVEFGGQTQLVPAAGGVTKINGEAHADPTARVAPLPGSDCAVGACPTATELAATREAHESELLAPTGPFTVTNSFSLTNGANGFMEIGLAADDKPLIAPTEVSDAQTGNVAALTAYNNAHAITLDDGSSLNYTTAASGTPMPWISRDRSIRVGAAATITGPVVLDFRNNAWKIQPTSQITGLGADTATFADTRPANALPQPVGGDLTLGTFNVLNYFNTTGVAFDAQPGTTCSYFNDRTTANPVTVNNCTPDGPRGAAEQEDFLRQQAKIVRAINTMDTDIVSLEEIENSVKLIGETDRDDALGALVAALNADAGGTRWAFAPSPDAADLPTLAEQDVIRTAFIYDPTTVALVGPSKVLVGSAPFANAREPLAQAFKAKGAPDADAFGVIVNHFKSKGSGVDDGTGQGNANPDRVAQAQALVAFADTFKAERSIGKLFLTGDFNSYSKEDPIQELEAAGYTQLESNQAGEESYSFSGLSGSLDHVLANAAALADVTGVDIWDINASEPIAYQYSRFNYNVTDFFDATVPFAASDHNPELIGINVPAIEPASREIQILATNDFHGRLLNNATNGEAGAAVLSGAVKQLRAANPDTVFAAAGDLIGASTFESFIQKDKPTIDALNEAGLEVSAAGNHEFDQGYDDLVNRVMAPYDATTNPLGGAEWQYIAANVRRRSDNTHALPESWMQTFGSVKVGFVGAVTEDLPTLVSPAGISSIAVTDIVDEANTTADALEAAGADVIVLLVHEGAATTGIASATDGSPFGQIVNGVDTNIDAIVSGHTHLAYNHAVTVPAWVTEGRAVTTRPVVSAGQYGTALNQLRFTVDTATGAVTAKTQAVLNLKTGQTANYPVDLPTKAIVDSAVSQAAVLGAVELGKIAGPFSRAKMANGITENRGGESTLGNLVAEVQRWATETPEAGAAQIAFMNPGGLRDDMIGNPGGYPATLTYRQAANVQSFANTLVNMRLTGTQIKTVLEQQWQPATAARPFLRLGTSEGFRFTYDPTKASGARITGISLNGTAIDPAASYSVTVNSFLASGGDNFFEFANGTQKRDTGKVDLQAMVDYMDEFANTAEGDVPLPVSYQQHAVGVSYPNGQPTAYAAGGAFDVDLSSLVFSAPSDLRDTSVDVRLDGRSIGSFPVDNTLGTVISDEYGKALVRATIPADTNEGPAVVRIVGNNTGTSVRLPIEVTAGADTTVTGTDTTITWPQAGSVPVQVTPTNAGGTVTLLRGDQVLGSTTLSDGAGSIELAARSLDPGTYRLSLQYGGGEGFRPATGFVTVTVLKADPQLTVVATPGTLQVKKDSTTVAIDVRVPGYTPTGFVAVYVDGALQRVVELAGGTASLTVGPFGTVGTKVLSVRYLGDEFTAAETSADVLIKVQKGRVRG